MRVTNCNENRNTILVVLRKVYCSATLHAFLYEIGQNKQIIVPVAAGKFFLGKNSYS